MKYFLITMFLTVGSLLAYAQNIDLLNLENELESVNITYTKETYKGQKSLKVVPLNVKSEAKFVKLNSTDFNNGVIEIDVVGKRKADAGDAARGFVGIAFRISDDHSHFECFYIRPTNGRANDQLRRNHSVQYISFPDFPWYKLRKENPGKYETYADLMEGEWTKLRIEVTNEKAKIYINDVAQPTMLVNDLKLGAHKSGKIGLWVGPGTEAHFSNLTVINN